MANNGAPDKLEGVREVQLVEELIADCQATAPERIARYLRVQHHGIVASTPFAPASAECIELFRDGHFHAAISLAQAVGEALVRHMSESNKWSPAKLFEENVGKLKTRGFIDEHIEGQLLAFWEKRDDYHHLNRNVATERGTLEHVAFSKIRALASVEAWVFEWSVSEPGKIAVKRPQVLAEEERRHSRSVPEETHPLTRLLCPRAPV